MFTPTAGQKDSKNQTFAGVLDFRAGAGADPEDAEYVQGRFGAGRNGASNPLQLTNALFRPENTKVAGKSSFSFDLMKELLKMKISQNPRMYALLAGEIQRNGGIAALNARREDLFVENAVTRDDYWGNKTRVDGSPGFNLQGLAVQEAMVELLQANGTNLPQPVFSFSPAFLTKHQGRIANGGALGAGAGPNLVCLPDSVDDGIRNRKFRLSPGFDVAALAPRRVPPIPPAPRRATIADGIEDPTATAELRRRIAAVMRDRRYTPAQRVHQREALLQMVARRNPGNGNMQSLFADKTRPQDASEFVGELLDAAIGDNPQLFEQHRQRQGVAEYEKGPRQAAPHMQLSIPNGAASVTGLFGYQQQFVPSDQPGTETSAKSICTPNAQELCICLKRFNNDRNKNRTLVSLDNIALEATDGSQRRFEPTALIVHSGAGLNGGHYFSYVKERRGWVCYNDDNSRVVPEREMTAILQSGKAGSGEAYMVKYSSLDAPRPALPEPQNGTINSDRVHGNRCWANAAMSFMSSFTSLGLERELVDHQADGRANPTPRVTASARPAPLRPQSASQPARRVRFGGDDEVHPIDGEAPANHHLSATRVPLRPASTRAAVASPSPATRTPPATSRPVTRRTPAAREVDVSPEQEDESPTPPRVPFADMTEKFLAKKEAQRKAQEDRVKITAGGVAEVKVGDGAVRLEKDDLRWTSQTNPDGTVEIQIKEERFKKDIMDYYHNRTTTIPKTTIKLIGVKADNRSPTTRVH